MIQSDTGKCENLRVSPNQPKTPARAFKPPPELWAKVVAEAEAAGTTYTAVVIAALEAHFANQEDE